MAEVQWYYARNEQQFGPISASELKQLAEGGRLSPDDLLWREGMEAWTTAVNLRGLFSDDSSPGVTKTDLLAPVSAPRERTAARSDRAPRPVAAPASLRSVLRVAQTLLWTTCVLVVLAAVILLTRAFLTAEGPAEEAAAATAFGTFMIGAYVLARAGEKLSRLLLTMASRRRK